MSKKAKVMVTVERDIDEYISELEDAHNSYYRHSMADVEQIPDAVFEWFCESLRDGTKTRIDGDGHPQEVFRRLMDESDYGAIEGFSPSAFLCHVLKAGRKLYAEENGGRKPGRKKLRQYIRNNRERCMEHSGLRDGILFWYRDDKSDYGISIALSLGC